MLEHIYLFGKGILSFEYDVPMYLKIAGFIMLGVLATCILLIFGDTLNMSIFKDSYMIYYFLVMINIINIVAVLFYYNKKSGSFIGDEGDKGIQGLKGEVGTEIDCSLCTHNIYMQKVQTYDNICQLNVNTFVNKLLGNTTNDSLLNNLLNSNKFNYTEFATSLLLNGFDMSNPTVKNIFTYINAFEFLLYNDINGSIGLSPDSNILGTFKRPFGKLGYYAFGDTCMGGIENFALTSYVINGDIILPTGFNQICTFTTINADDTTDNYGVYKIIPPEWTPIIQTDLEPDKRDLTRRLEKGQDKDEYLALGYVVAPLTSEGIPDKQLFACVKRSCCNKLKKSRLKLICIYPALSNMSYDNLSDLNNKSNTSSNNNNNKDAHDTSGIHNTSVAPDTVGVLSVWRTPYNSIYVKYMDSTKLMFGSTLIEQMYLNMNTGSVSQNLYTRYGTIKRVIKERVRLFLSKIKLNTLVVLGILFSHTFEKVNTLLKEYYDRFIGSGSKEIPNTPYLQSKLGVDIPSLEYNDIPKILKEISNSISIEQDKLLKEHQRTIAKIQKTRILKLGEFQDSKVKKADEVSYNAVKQYQQIRTVIATLSVNVENSDTLLDVVNNIFDSGIDTTLEENNITYAQEVVLYVCGCLLQPEEDIWIMKNSCLVYEKIDEERITLQDAIGDEVKRINNITNTIGTQAEEQCGKRDLGIINSSVERTYENLMKYIGHIPDALQKLNNLDLEEFSNQQLEYVLGELKKLSLFIESKCS